MCGFLGARQPQQRLHEGPALALSALKVHWAVLHAGRAAAWALPGCAEILGKVSQNCDDVGPGCCVCCLSCSH